MTVLGGPWLECAEEGVKGWSDTVCGGDQLIDLLDFCHHSLSLKKPYE